MKQLLLIATLTAASFGATSAFAQIPTTGLRLWLKADSLTLAEDAQVTQWVDSSPYATIFAPRTTSEPNGPFAGAPVEEYPHIQTVTLNGRSFPTVSFERNGNALGNPAVDRSGSTDRLYQVNNRTPGSDPLAIADGTSVSTFTVFRPNVTTSGAYGYQAIWAKRGNDASLLQLGIQNDGRFNYVTYDSVTGYAATNPATANAWQIVSHNITEAGANDPVNFLVNDTQDPNNSLILNPVSTNGGVIANRNDSINNDPVGVVEPFGIGGHAQDCCGEGETFGGNIAEIIIYARELNTAETDLVYSYLAEKYLGPITYLGGDYNGDQIVDAGDYVVWRDNVGLFTALPNSDPAALSEGFVDEEDYDYWVANYGRAITSSAASHVVAEPASASLAAVGWLSLVLMRRGRNQSERPSPA
jgi:hypothetical protein